MVLLALVLAAHAASPPKGCVSAVPTAQWVVELGSAETAFAALDETAFDASMTRAAMDLPCLDAVVDSSLAGRYHRLVGLRLYVRRQEESARLSFAAARAVDPDGIIPSAMLPLGHEARALAESAVTPGATVPAPRPRRGTLVFDGSTKNARPVDRPTLVQLQIGDTVEASAYVAPGQALPFYRPLKGTPLQHWLLAGGGLALGLTSALCLASVGDSGEDGAERLRVAGVSAGVLGAGAVTASVLRW